MTKYLLLTVLVVVTLPSIGQDLSQTNCEACYKTVNDAIAPNMARLFNFTNTSDIKESFKSWFYSDDFERYIKNSSTGLSIPFFDDVLKFSNSSNSDWQRRKVIKSQESFEINDHFFTKFWSLNPDISMAGEFNRALQTCNEGACQDNQGRVVFLGKVVRTENSVTIPFNFVKSDDTQSYPVVADIEYDKTLFSLEEKKWLGKKINTTNAIVLRKKPGNKWPRSFFGISFKNGIKGISFYIDGEITPGFVIYKAFSGVKVPSCQPYSLPTFTNEGNHYNRLGRAPFNLKIGRKIAEGGDDNNGRVEVIYTTEPTSNEATLLVQITLPILADGRKYRDIRLVRQGEHDARVHDFVQPYIDYYENGVLKPGLVESNHVRVRVYNRAEWVRFSVSGLTCSYSDQEVTGELDVSFDTNNTAIVDLPSNCTSGIVRVEKNGIRYRLDLLNPSSSSSSVAGLNVLNHFAITAPAPGQHVYTIKYRL
ncbi:hypothetical protein [Chitinophaga sp. S165]|uniref:hypothetical protein n=1 Tax=Chitinophaga sp. S165 TaxID=2135462 RepID=UPI000D89A8C9|nr:hypothetical protein [Chitinophaga sp. S165]PWV55562.1 hypothetical protein C7475_10168 [Chitinophaga sp. S165]